MISQLGIVLQLIGRSLSLHRRLLHLILGLRPLGVGMQVRRRGKVDVSFSGKLDVRSMLLLLLGILLFAKLFIKIRGFVFADVLIVFFSSPKVVWGERNNRNHES